MKGRCSHTYSIPKPTYPKLILFFDTETTRKENIKVEKKTKSGGIVNLCKHRLLFGYYILVKFNEEKQKYTDIEGNFFHTTKQFRNLVIKLAEQNEEIWVMAHNLGFDYRVCNFHLLKRSGWQKSDSCFVDGQRFIIEWVKLINDNPHKILFIDSMNYFKTSIEQLGQIFGKEKLGKRMKMNLAKYDITRYINSKIKYEYNGKTWTGKELVYEYCKRDVEILKIAICNFFESLIKESVKIATTLAGCSFNHLKSMLPVPIHVHCIKEVEEMEINAYFGGRTECFFIGHVNETIYKLDVNSLYPSVMINNPYPVKYLKTIENPTKEKFEKIKKLNKEGKIVYIVEAIVNLKKPKLPHKLKDNEKIVNLPNNINIKDVKGKLIFPIGQFEGCWCSPEFNLLDDDEIIKIKRIAVYKAFPIFKEFITKLYNARLEAKKKKDKVNDLFFKLRMNSSYGKFGQKVKKMTRVPEMDLNVLLSGLVKEPGGNTWKYIDGEAYLVDTKETLSFDSFPAIASFVTSYARAKMYEFLELIGFENVYYMDTDSLFTNEKGYKILLNNGLVDSKELGKLDLEDVCNGGVTIHTLKDYELWIQDKWFGFRFKKDTKMKGVPKNAQFIGFTEFGKPLYLYEKFIGFMEGYRLFGCPILGTVSIEKELKRQYSKRMIHPDGTTEPFQLEIIK